MITKFGKLIARTSGMALMAGALALASCSPSAQAPTAPKTEFNIGWSIYAGWMPWPYAQQAGIVKKWADKYGIKINIVQVNDYVESVNQYTAGKFDGVTVANMDALTIPAAGGKDTSASFNHLSPADRKAILEILQETKPDFAAFVKQLG